ncbi:MAG: hypothetical protein A2V85_17070 [Chloroflexi bacterium RBG_16_72_14]|nr:MAG: hypothetical protein A2V85_17070 [Chloroflexi bacterium RBG_16_72_14]
MEAGGVIALAITAGVLGGLVLLVARGPETLANLFHAEQMGWPHGVQEDDDVRWCWPAALQPPHGRRRPQIPGAYRVPPQPVRGHVTHR